VQLTKLYENIFGLDIHVNQVVLVEMIDSKEEVYHTFPDGVLLQLSQLTLLLETAMAQLELLIESCFFLPAMISRTRLWLSCVFLKSCV